VNEYNTIQNEYKFYKDNIAKFSISSIVTQWTKWYITLWV